MSIFENIQNLNKKNQLLLKDEYKKLKSFKGGALGEIAGIFALIKIGLIIIGTSVLSYWPYVFIITLYCVFKEYEISSKTDKWGFTIFFNMLWAFCCPCCWGIYRTAFAWNNRGYTTSGLYGIEKDCGPGFFLDWKKLDNNQIETSEKCLNAIFPQTKKLKQI